MPFRVFHAEIHNHFILSTIDKKRNDKALRKMPCRLRILTNHKIYLDILKKE